MRGLIVEPELAQAYAAESARLVRQRLVVIAGLFVVLMGVVVGYEAIAHADRRTMVVGFWVAECAATLLAAAAAHAPGLADRPGIVGAVLMGVLAGLITYYNVLVGIPVETAALGIGVLLNGIAVLAPWGPLVQGVGAALSFVAFAAIVLPTRAVASADSWVISSIAVGVAGVTSTLGAQLLERYRREAFRRASLHAEEAEIAATLQKVAETLSVHLGAPDMLERVNRLAVETIGCDWSSTFLYDQARGAYRLAANFGSSEAVRRQLDQLEFGPDSMPLLQQFRAGTLVEIVEPDDQALVPVALLRRTETASALYAPIGRGEQIVGVLVVGYRTRRGRFSARQRRLALGFAHATAVALENARLIATLQATSRLKSDFVATMSHELRTPLNVIMGYAEMLAEDVHPAGTAQWHQMLERIQRASVELMDLITATLDMGRLEAGRDTVVLAPVSFARLLEEIAHEVEPLVPPGVRFVHTSALRDDPVTTDGAKVKTIVKNLVGNALKFTTSGTVEVATRADGELVVVVVRDTGIGIAPEYLPVIFEMFRQVDGSTTRRYGGVGLGLHIVKQLITLLGGTIDVESTPGVGSAFTVTLPVSRAAAQRATGT